MKKIILFILPLFLITLFTGCTVDSNAPVLNNEVVDEVAEEESGILQVDDEGNTSFNSDVLSNLLNEAKIAELSAEEIAGIKFMLEEEKLARDVYKKLFEKWGQQTFNNISQSEETHIRAVRNLAQKYGIDTGFYNDEVGKFTDEVLSGLYNDLVAKGESSLPEALNVGALIEEIDIVDLEEYLKQTNNEDIALVYENLIRGSRNHLRSFVRTMSRQGQNYEAQRLSAANYEEIVNSENEQGSRQGSGQGRNRK